MAIKTTSGQAQPDQAALEKRERRKAYQREWDQQNRERRNQQKRESARRRYHQNPEPFKGAARKWEQQNRNRVNERKRERYRRKKEAKRGGETIVFLDPSATSTTPENPAPDRPRSTKARNNP
jgi:hypothetical protein